MSECENCKILQAKANEFNEINSCTQEKIKNLEKEMVEHHLKFSEYLASLKSPSLYQRIKRWFKHD